MLENLGVKLEWRTREGAVVGRRKPVHLPEVIDWPDWQGTTERLGRLGRHQAVIGTFNLGEDRVQTS